MFAISRVHLHQFLRVVVCVYMNFGSFFSCAPIFSCSLFFVCIYINFASTCVRLHEFWFFFLVRANIKMVPFSPLCLHQNSCFYSFASTSKNGSYFSCASSSNIFTFSPVRLHQNVCLYSGAAALKCFSSAPTSIFACICVCMRTSKWFFTRLRQH